MVRTGRSRFWDARWALAAGLIGLGLASLVALVRGQKPVDNQVVAVQRPSLGVDLSLSTGRQESELELRVRTRTPVESVPVVEFQDTAGGTVRAVQIEAEQRGVAWVARIEQLPSFGVGYIHVTVTDDSGVAERHELRFATRGAIKNQPNVVYSVDGRFAFVVLAAGMPTDTRFLVNTLESADPPLPAGVQLEAGPFEIRATQQIPDRMTAASVAIHLVAWSPNSGAPRSYQVRWLKPAGEAWEILPTTMGLDGSVAQAAVSHLGVFVLTSESR